MALNNPNTSGFTHFKIAHELKRRIRIIAPCLLKDPERCYILEIILHKREAIEEIRTVARIGSVVITFDADQLPKANLLKLLDATLGNIGSKSHEMLHGIKKHTVDPSIPEENLIFAITGMSCASCALFLEIVLKRNPNISKANVNFVTETGLVSGRLSKEEVFDLIEEHGYEAFPIDTFSERRLLIEREQQQIIIAKKRVILAGILSLPVVLIGVTATRSQPLRLLQALLATPIVFWTGRSFFNNALKLARQGSSNMDTLISIGAGTAYGYSIPALFKRSRHLYFEAATGIIVFVLLGRYLEERAKGKAGEEIRQLVDLQPQNATLLSDGKEIIINIEDISVGDILLVRPGEKIPADGEVIKGLSSVDESMVTGSSIPVVKEIGNQLIGGCVNGSSVLQMRAAAVGTDTVLSGIIHMVDQAQATKLPIQKTVDRVSAVFVPSVMVLSALTFAGWMAAGVRSAHALGNALSVLLISCPCALGLATPAATMVGNGQAARRGIYIRHGESLETAAGISTILFDKTGTITEGKSNVTSLLNISRMADKTIIGLAASAEFNSEHYLGRAIVAYARDQGIKVSDATHFHSIPDSGIRAKTKNRDLLIGNEAWLSEQGIDLSMLSTAAVLLADKGETPVFMAVDGKEAALFSIVDQTRPDARPGIERLHRRGILTLMVTGDLEKTARYIAEQVNIENVIAEASPAKKLEIIREMQEQGHLVAMIGDGINDAPALAAADVGFAVGTGSGIAIQTADLTLVNGDISKVADAIELSDNTLHIIKQNLFWAFGYNVLAIPVAVMGKLNPIIASAAMALSSVSVIINSLRLYRK